MKNCDDLIFNSLHQYFLSIGYQAKSKTFFIKSFNGGYWFIKIILNCKNKEVKMSYQIGFHLYVIEKLVAYLKEEKYNPDSITGSCNMGHLFNPPIYYEQLIDLYIEKTDVLFDTSYHIDKYVDPLVNKYDNLNAFKASILFEKELNDFSIGFFNKLAFYIISNNFQKTFEIINLSYNIFRSEDDKNRFIDKVKEMERLY